MISYTFVPMAKVERLRALERQPIYTPSISMPTPSRTPSKVGTVYTTVTPAIKEARDREYISKLSRAIGSDRDKISALETELRKLRDRPETRVEYEEVRHTIDYDISDLKRLLDSPAQRFIDDFAIPVMTVGSALFPGASVATAPAVATTCARFIPTLGRAAIAFGAEEAYQRITTFFSELYDRKAPMGHSGKPIETPKGTSRNPDKVINGRKFIGHALDRMQGRGVTVSIVEDIIKTGEKILTYGNRIKYYSQINKLSVITEQNGTVISIVPGSM